MGQFSIKNTKAKMSYFPFRHADNRSSIFLLPEKESIFFEGEKCQVTLVRITQIGAGTRLHILGVTVLFCGASPCTILVILTLSQT